MKIKFKKLITGATIPFFATKGAAGMDITTVEGYVLAPGERHIFGTGLACAVEEGYEVQVRPRSGLACKSGITVLNTPGTIDSDYRGEIRICLYNTNAHNHVIMPGERIAQLVINKIEQPEIEEVEDLDETERGEGGFGSTGV